MKIEIRGLRELQERLARVRVEEVMARALAEQSELLAQAVKDRLSDAPGSGGHDRPWLQTGELRDSIGAQSSGLEASVGSSDPAAAPQEMALRDCRRVRSWRQPLPAWASPSPTPSALRCPLL